MRLRLFLLTLVVLCPGLPLMASPYENQPYHEKPMTLGGAVSRARQDYNGRVISAETEKSGRHNIKILTDDGRVRRLQYGGRPGQNAPSSRER